MSTSAIYSTRIRHARTEPVRHAFEYTSYSWYVDLDALPALPRWLAPLARFRAEDHFAPPPPGTSDTLRGRIDAVLAGHGIDLGGGRVTALVNARVLGYVFNPLSVYWCHNADGSLRCIVAEVHNTYGQRHSYLIRPDDHGHGEVGKVFYVSPFNNVEGRYDMRFPEPGERLSLNVVLHRDGHAPFTATVRGNRQSVTTRTVLRTQLRMPLAPLVVSIRIRIQGITLWARGLPVIARPEEGRRKESVQ
ncbi:MAG: DUF1365 domain-containing protein [Rhodococcus sp. (in: high G+C Gram-positive bacteria)]|uniref:DUF1365 domain-containing protein n=1 Tax=Rhodococcus sp. TaxID=1831 RepID=UPI003BAFDACE